MKLSISIVAFLVTLAPAWALAQAPAAPGASTLPAQAGDPAYAKSIEDWRARVDRNLRADNSWLTLAGRYVLKPGENLFGTAKTNDVVFPPGLGPAGMGSVFVEPDGNIRVKLVEGLQMKNKDGIAFTERLLVVEQEKHDWMSIGRATFQFIQRGDKTILRLADKESETRKRFGGRVWYPVDDRYRVPAKYVAYNPPRTVQIVNIIDQVSDEPVLGYVEFELAGRPYRLDVLDDDGLFFIFRDDTANDTTYGAGRYLHIAKADAPKLGEAFKLDLNKAYNPPCAFTEFATCPLPPKQNILKVKIEAGEKYPPLKKEL